MGVERGEAVAASAEAVRESQKRYIISIHQDTTKHVIGAAESSQETKSQINSQAHTSTQSHPATAARDRACAAR